MISGYSYPSALCDVMLDFIGNYHLSQIVDTPTRHNHVLDIFLTNRPTLI